MVIRIGVAARRTGLSVAEFQRLWHDRHGPLVAKFKGIRHIWQNHALLREGMPILPWPGFDACSEMVFDDLAAVQLALSEENYPRDLREDSPHVVDMSTSGVMLAERVHVEGTVDLRDVRLLTFMQRAPGRSLAQLHESLRAVPKASQARAREVYVPLEAPGFTVNAYDGVDAQWFESASRAERYLVSAEALEHRRATAHLVRGTERVIVNVRVVL